MDRKNNLRPMGLGDILDYTFNIYRENFLRLVVAFGILTFPINIISSIVDNSSSLMDRYTKILTDSWGNKKAMAEGFKEMVAANNSAAGSMWAFIILAIAMVAALIYMPAMYKMVSEAFNGRVMTVEDAYKHSARKFLYFAASALLFSFIIIFVYIAAIIALAVIFVVLYIISRSVSWLGILLAVVFGLCAFFIILMGSFYAYGSFSFMTIALTVEEKGPLEAMKRGFNLAGFKLLRFAGVSILMSLIIGFPSMILSGIGVAISSITKIDIIQHIITAGAGVIFGPLMFVLITVLYYDYKIRREAMDIEQSYSEIQ